MPLSYPSHSFTLVVNAGGQSRRMGQPKALLPVPPDGSPLLFQIFQRLEPLVECSVVVLNETWIASQAGLPSSVTVIADRYPDTGALGGIATGLQACSDWAMLVACDMPFLDPSLFAHLRTLASEQENGQDRWDAIVPYIGGYAEPFHAIYHRRCLPLIELQLAKGERRANSFYSEVRLRRVEEVELRLIDPQLRSFVNVNTPEDWQQALHMFEQSVENVP
ncbi:MAG: molybdenum cofactor guanylyltransferase [Caldilineaceae bacterium]